MQTSWVQTPTPRPDARLRLYCIPYAGGAPGIFRDWSQALDARVELRAVLLPGRERRFTEPALSSVDAITEVLVPALLTRLDPPFAIFGHSLGALLGFEVARRLTARGQPPAHLLVSAARAPHLPRRGPDYHRMEDAELMDAVGDLGGTPPELLAQRELLEIMLPTLRADFAAAETYHRQAGPPLPTPITAFGGAGDPLVLHSDIEGWAAHTAAGFEQYQLPGDHFFIATAHAQLLDLVGRTLERHLEG